MPTNVTELKSFLGLLNYHKFLPDLATLPAPLHQLLRKDTKWIWTEMQNDAFKKAKSLLHSDSLLVHYDEQKLLIIACDASSYGLAAVPSHCIDDGCEPLLPEIYHQLRKNIASMRKKHQLSYAIRKFHDYIDGCKFIIYSDHNPLQYLLNQSKHIAQLSSSWIQQWAIALSAYNYIIKHKPGSQLSHASALNRLRLPDQPSKVPMPQDVVLVLNHNSDTIIC
uniref:Reverse transcriptase RNase H-like domain-containing protein n=1 Tax=Amphimedon queenslandica TaxID=400682 RepID=A0A1X7T1B7_AMPQE